MKKRLFLAAVASAAALVGGTTAPAAPLNARPLTVVKTCSSSYTRAVIGGRVKCLRAGEYCARRYERQYRRYGFSCAKRDYRGRYHLIRR